MLTLCSVLYMALIHYLSSIPGDSGGEQDAIWRVVQWLAPNVRSVLHVPLYAVLAWLWCRTLEELRFSKAASVLIAVGIMLAYGGFDEWHQASVPGRYASLTDWVLDAFGAAAGSWFYLRQSASRVLSSERNGL